MESDGPKVKYKREVICFRGLIHLENMSGVDGKKVLIVEVIFIFVRSKAWVLAGVILKLKCISQYNTTYLKHFPLHIILFLNVLFLLHQL